MRVLFLTKYPRRGPSSRYRVNQFIPYLEKEGFTCEVQSLHSEDYLDSLYSGRKAPARYHIGRFLRRVVKVLSNSRYSAIYIQKELLPYVPPFLELFLRLRGAKVIYDIDDAIFLFYTGARNPMVRLLLGPKIPIVLESSSVVLAGNVFLRDYAARYNKRTILFPTVLDPSKYLPRGDAAGEAGTAPHRFVPVVGWIGSPETVHFLYGIGDVLRRVARSDRMKLLTIGVPGFTIPGLETEAVPWSEETEAEKLRCCDIGIMPLPDTDWAKGKCGLKLLQYMASSLPVVSSPDGGASDIIDHGVNGLIASSDGQWYEHLTTLIRDPELRARLGREGRRRVEEDFSLDLWAPRMAELLRRVIGGESMEGSIW